VNFDVPEQLNTTSYFLDHNLEQGRGERTAVYCRNGRFTYGDIAALTNQVGNVLKDLGVEPENRVYIALPDSPEFVASFYGVQKIGASTIVAYTYLSTEDFRYEIELLRPKVVIADQSCMERLREAASGRKYPSSFLVLGRAAGEPGPREFDFHAMAGEASDRLEAESTHREDYARWGFTGGSTGHPKAVPVPHSSLVYSFQSMQQILHYTMDDVILSVPKMFFGYGRTGTIVHPFRVGAASVLFPERTTPRRIFEFVEQYRPTILLLVPTMMRQMLEISKEERPHFSCIRFCTCAGESLSAELHEEWEDAFGCEVINMLGSAEMGYVYVSNRPGEVVRGSVGKPIPGYEVKIVDESGLEVSEGEVGVLMAKGPTSGFFYLRMPKKSRQVFRGEWVYTGDLFRRDRGGNLWFIGRADNLIKVSGVWTSPLEIEGAVQTHPDVVDCAVVGVKDRDGLQKTRAYVILKQGIPSTKGKAEEIRDFVKRRLSPYKYPRSIEFVTDLPKTSSGKVDRTLLKEQAE
jgi:benzoate-CoA ligase family protein